MINFFLAQIHEIKDSKSLRFFGLSLIIAHFASFILFFDSGTPWVLKHYPICWTFYPNCEWGRTIIFQHSNLFIHIYLITILSSLICFLSQRWKGYYVSLIAATLVKLSYTIHDYRMMGNYHYMLYFALFIYLLVPQKVFTLKWFLVFCYISAGLLRFESDWLTGASFSPLPMFSQKMIELAAAYVVLLECIIAFLLLSKKPRWFYFAGTQILFFHIFSFQMVGWFFPLIMLCLLTIFIFERLFEKDFSILSLSAIYKNYSKYNISLLFLFAFVLIQIVPRWVYPNSAVDGAGRILFLNMFDGRTECDGRVLIHQKNDKVIERVEQSIETSVRHKRIKCDPLVFLAKAKDLCRKLKEETTFIDLDIYLIARRVTETRWIKTLDHRNFCSEPPTVNLLGEVKNDI